MVLRGSLAGEIERETESERERRKAQRESGKERGMERKKEINIYIYIYIETERVMYMDKLITSCTNCLQVTSQNSQSLVSKWMRRGQTGEDDLRMTHNDL